MPCNPECPDNLNTIASRHKGDRWVTFFVQANYAVSEGSCLGPYRSYACRVLTFRHPDISVRAL
jgi:hypothetical protein